MFWYSGLAPFYKTPTLRTLAPWLCVYAFYLFAVIYLQENYFDFNFFVPNFIMYILGYMIMVLFYFRLNNSYYRWYEGRKNITYLAANAETMLLKLNSYLIQADTRNRNFFYHMLNYHMYASKDHLRKKRFEGLFKELDGQTIEILKQAEHVPNKIMELIHAKVTMLYKNEYISRVEYFELSKHIERANTYLDNCDTIRTTKTTKSYVNHITMFLILYSLALPFAFTDEIIEYWIIPLLCLIFYAYFGCEVMSAEVENPFGYDKNDLPLEHICADVNNCLTQIKNNG